MTVACLAIAKSGSRCRRPALAGKQHCLMHDPESAELRREAGRKGGHARSNQARAAKAMRAALTSAQLLIRLSQVIDKAEKGEIEPGVVNCISGAARTMTEIRKSTEIERRLEELEQRAGLMNDRRFG
jgi:hypothetical protein